MSTIASGLPDEVVTCLQNARFVSHFNVLAFEAVVLLCCDPLVTRVALGQLLFNSWTSSEGYWTFCYGVATVLLFRRVSYPAFYCTMLYRY